MQNETFSDKYGRTILVSDTCPDVTQQNKCNTLPLHQTSYPNYGSKVATHPISSRSKNKREQNKERFKNSAYNNSRQLT